MTRATRCFCLACLFALVDAGGSAQTIRYTVETLAGGDPVRDGNPALSAIFRSVYALAFDRSGRLWIADTSGHRIRLVVPEQSMLANPAQAIAYGAISTVAGVGFAAYSGEGGPAPDAHLSSPRGIAVDGDGNVFVADSGNHRIRKVDPAGRIVTVSGGGDAVAGTEGVAATSVQLLAPADVFVAEDGSMYFTEATGRIRRVARDGVIRTIAGEGTLGVEADGGPAREARLMSPRGLVQDAQGNLYFVEQARSRVRKISPEGIISTVAGAGGLGDAGDGGPAFTAQLNNPRGLAIDEAGNIYVSTLRRIRMISPDGAIQTYLESDASGVASFLTFDGQGNLWAGGSSAVFLMRGESATTVLGRGVSRALASAAQETLVNPIRLTAGTDGLVYFSEAGYYPRILVIDRRGALSIFYEYGGSVNAVDEGGPLSMAILRSPLGIVAGANGDLWIGDLASNRIRKITRWNGLVNTVAGNGTRGSDGDGGMATHASLTDVSSLAVDSKGNVFVINYPKIRKVGIDGRIETFVGSGQRGYSGDDGPATNADLEPFAISVDRENNLLIAEPVNRRIRLVSPDGIIRTVAGGGTRTGEGPATEMTIDPPLGVAGLSSGGFVFSTASSIFLVDGAGWLQRIAGGDLPGFSGDGGPALEARLNPSLLWAEPDGSVLFIDSGNQRIRRLVPLRDEPHSEDSTLLSAVTVSR